MIAVPFHGIESKLLRSDDCKLRVTLISRHPVDMKKTVRDIAGLISKELRYLVGAETAIDLFQHEVLVFALHDESFPAGGTSARENLTAVLRRHSFHETVFLRSFALVEFANHVIF